MATSMVALEMTAADTSAGRLPLAVSDVENEGAGTVRPFKSTQAPQIVANELAVVNGSMLTLKSSPTTVTPLGSSWSTDNVTSSIGTLHRCSRIGGSVGTSQETKRRHPTVAADAVRRRFMRYFLVGRESRKRVQTWSLLRWLG
jgi:hypothetical protein